MAWTLTKCLLQYSNSFMYILKNKPKTEKKEEMTQDKGDGTTRHTCCTHTHTDHLPLIIPNPPPKNSTTHMTFII